jgi:capsular polysaccharide biosynthesis protein
LCVLNNVSVVPNSDFIRGLNGFVSNEKLYRKEYNIFIPRDNDLLEIKGQNIRLFNRKHKVYSNIAFSLLGTISYHWAHFLVQYYPKLMFLEHLPENEVIDIIILKNTDPHIKFLIDREIKLFKNLKILEVDEEAEIICNKLYHVSLGTFLADDGYISTPFACIISNSTLKFWKDKALEIVPKESIQFRKIYLSRSSVRTLKNSNEIEDFFVDKGFEVVFPHLISFEEKVKIFNEAKYIVGPASSAFTNVIYSKPSTKILVFINAFRNLDTYLPAFSNYIGQDLWFMTGKDDDTKAANSNYEIYLKNIENFINSSNFLDHVID